MRDRVRRVPTIGDVVAAMDRLYDPARAESWDAVGMVCGEPDAVVRRVLFAVDPVTAIAEEAVAWGADLVVTHHPLFLRPVHGVAATSPKGRLVHRLIGAGIALHTAHTNADSADPGVSDALAVAIGLGGSVPCNLNRQNRSTNSSSSFPSRMPSGFSTRLLPPEPAPSAHTTGARGRRLVSAPSRLA
jgi:putative NIF3 family GTP cyclohydrolase 1 type 2